MQPTTTLYGWGAAFDLPSPSPCVMKADIQLQLLGVEFERATADLESVPKHKAPYVRTGGDLIEDSTFIRAHFERTLGKDLDAGLSPRDRAAAWALERMLEDQLILIMAHDRWLEDANFQKGPAMFFAAVPEAAREQVKTEVRTTLREMMVRQGIGRHSRAERMELAARGIAAVAAHLGDRTYMFGDQATGLDGAAFGVLASCGTRFFDSPLPELIDSHDNLRPYLARMQQRFFSESRWPRLSAA